MAFLKYDYQCPTCEVAYPDMMVISEERDQQRCGKCKSILKRLPAGPITTFKFGDRSAIKSKKAVSLRDKHG